MNHNCDKDVEYILKAADSLEYGLWKYFDRIGHHYQQFINSASLKCRRQHLDDLRLVAIDMHRVINKAIGERNVPIASIRNFSPLMKDTVNSRYLNLTQLYQNFVHAAAEDKLKYLTAMWFNLKDLAQVAETTSCEPEPLLAPTCE